MKIKWSGIEHPNHDLCLKTDKGYYDVFFGSNGWRVLHPKGKSRLFDSRDDAKKFAEKLIENENN